MKQQQQVYVSGGLPHKNKDKKLQKSLLNVDVDLEKEIFEQEGIIPPPVIDDLGRSKRQLSDKVTDSPVRPYYQIRNIAVNSHDPGYVNRILIGTPTTGNVRMEWVLARYGQIIPTNWSQVQLIQYMSTYAPIQYQVADAQNLIVKEFIEKDFEWLFLLEHDVILPVDAFVRINAHIRSEKNPIVSGLYFTKSIPAEPMIYRGRGNSYYTGWNFGEMVYADGVPTGCLLINHSILKVMWDSAEEYIVRGTNVKARRVFSTPRDIYFDELTGQWNSTTGTSDLDWCSRVIEDKVFEKAGWKEHARMKYPFLVDTNIFCRQIDEQGIVYPQ